MAEERIGITKFKDNETPDFELCAYKLMTRTEAKKIIAKALFEAVKKAEGQISWYDAGAAALNALLGDK